jgi:DNA-binding CsgD family transcriptional regulator
MGSPPHHRLELMLGLARTGAREIEQRMVALRSVAQQSFPVAWKGWELLTPAEREVAELVCTGLTNKQIAATSLCSPHTVDSHLRAIYRKLGVTSRAALAGHVTRLNEAVQAERHRYVESVRSAR